MVLAIATAGVLIANLETTDKPVQISGLDIAVANWATKINAAPNAVAATELMAARETTLFKAFAIDTRGYSGKGIISGIAPMHEGGGLSVTAGRVTLTAGVIIGDGLDTLIKLSEPVHDQLLQLSVGDEVEFRGIFPATSSNSMALLNYSAESSISHPNYLFKFSAIDKIRP